ncbi:MAG: PqqD family protein [Lachnospiraceae bacterium]|nr:PqqD family protein [Lachnospiraceae bacterium]MBR3165173.1 PqqD family protein [Lachnospiraceae bacterium]
MKLKDDCMIQVIDDVQYLAAGGDDSSAGAMESNRTAAYIVTLLAEETTEEKIVDALFERYDAPREEIAADVAEILAVLRGIGVLEEG